MGEFVPSIISATNICIFMHNVNIMYDTTEKILLLYTYTYLKM